LSFGLRACANPAWRKESPIWRTMVFGGIGGGAGAGAPADAEAEAEVDAEGPAELEADGLSAAVALEVGAPAAADVACAEALALASDEDDEDDEDPPAPGPFEPSCAAVAPTPVVPILSDVEEVAGAHAASAPVIPAANREGTRPWMRMLRPRARRVGDAHSRPRGALTAIVEAPPKNPY
jgi:hypothetical protein